MVRISEGINGQITHPKNVVFLKRRVPKHRIVKQILPIQFPFTEIIARDFPILLREQRYWPQDLKEKLAYYHISGNQFTRFLRNETHITLYELQAIAQVLNVSLEIKTA